MSLIDSLLLSAVLAVAGWWIVAYGNVRRILLPAPLALIALAGLQFAIEGYYWQFLPAYLLIFAVSLLSFRHSTAPRRSGRLARFAIRFTLSGILLLAVSTWVFLPVPRLTETDGRYGVGTQIFRWIDQSRAEEATADPADRRNVIVQAWYPIAPGTRGGHSTYMDGLNHLPAKVSIMPSFVMRHYDRIDTHGVLGAAVSPDQRKWPVVIFSPGYGAARAFYTGFVTGLASRGYIVLAIDHPYESAITELADGRIATTVEHFSKDDPDRTNFMNEHLEVRAADVRFVLDQLARANILGTSLSDRLDLDRIAVVGHSFGGATAAVLMDRDERVKAAANIDGTLYGSIQNKRLQHPFLLLESDHAETRHSQRYLSGNAQLLENLDARGYRYEIHRANHYSFTDVPAFLSPPGRWVLAQGIGGEIGPVTTHRATTDILAAFLQEALTGAPGQVRTVAAHYDGITGGPVK